MDKLKVLDLFSGIGGFSLGLERTGGFETVAFCEIEPFCQKVLRKHWPNVPIFEDVRKSKGGDIGRVDVICGGYPCQPFSLAGKREGEGDDRHLWPEVRRLLQETGASWFLGENVIGHVSLGLDSVLSDLEALGYTWQAFVIPACAVGARHRRDRVWIVANSERDCIQGRKTVWQDREVKPREEQLARLFEPCTWPTLSSARSYRADDGVPDRVHRNKALGNSIVPQIPEMIGRAILASRAGF